MELKGKRVLVVGLGESGLAMAKWLHRQGALVRVADSRDTPPNVDALQRVAPGAELIAGPFVEAPFASADLVALSPGVAKATPVIAAVDGKNWPKFEFCPTAPIARTALAASPSARKLMSSE